MNGTNYEVPHCGAFSIPHSHPSWAQIFASGSCFQIPLAWIPPLMFMFLWATYTRNITDTIARPPLTYGLLVNVNTLNLHAIVLGPAAWIVGNDVVY